MVLDSKQEYELLNLIYKGYTVNEIAEKFIISETTVYAVAKRFDYLDWLKQNKRYMKVNLGERIKRKRR